MVAAVRLREDYSAPKLRRLAREARDANQARRLLALAAVKWTPSFGQLSGRDKVEASAG